MYCAYCGSAMPDGAQFCGTCGKQLAPASVISAAYASTAQASMPQPVQSYQPPAASVQPVAPAPVELSVDIDAIAQELDQNREGYHQLMAQIVELERQFKAGRMTQEVHDAARRRLIASRPDGESAANDADVAWLAERYGRGEMSETAYKMRLSELKGNQASQQAARQTAERAAANPNDSGSFGYAFLGFLFPLIGLILYLVWKDDKPLSAKAAGKGALVSVIVAVVAYIIYFIVIASMVSSVVHYH